MVEKLEPTDVTLGDGDQHDVEVVKANRLRVILQDHLDKCTFYEETSWACVECKFIKERFGVLLK